MELFRYLITVEYDGTAYCGWQRQKNGVSIQQTTESAWRVFFDEDITLHSAGRTDAGVHAHAMPAHFDSRFELPPKKIVHIFNSALPRDICVKTAQRTHNNFNARFCAVKKTYRYLIHNSPVKPALLSNRAAHIRQPLDLEAMRTAAQHFLGTHDFKAFCASGSKVKDFVRTVYELTAELPAGLRSAGALLVTPANHNVAASSKQDSIASGDRDPAGSSTTLPASSSKINNGCGGLSPDTQNCGGLIEITVTGNGFLYNMVRIIAGTLVAVGSGKIKAEQIPDIIKSKNRRLAAKTLPPWGLYLVEVFY